MGNAKGDLAQLQPLRSRERSEVLGICNPQSMEEFVNLSRYVELSLLLWNNLCNPRGEHDHFRMRSRIVACVRLDVCVARSSQLIRLDVCNSFEGVLKFRIFFELAFVYFLSLNY